MTASPTYMGGCFLNANLSSFNGTSQMIFGGDRRSGNNTTEANAQLRIRAAGTLSGLGCNAATNTSNPSGSTIRLRVNGANVNQVIAITGNTTGQFQDTTHSDSVAATDLVCTSLVVTGTGAGFILGPYCYVFTGTTVVASMLGGGSGGDSVAASTTRFFPLIGSDSNTPGIFQTAESEQNKFPIRAAMTLSNMQIRVSSNSSTNAVTVTLRKTGADGNNAVSLTAATTGTFEDTTHSDSVAATDNVCGRWVTGAGTSNTTLISFGALMASVSTAFDLGSSATYSSSTDTISVTVATFDPMHGTHKIGHSTVEADTQIKIPFGATMSHLRCSVSSATGMSGAATMKFRKNGADGSMSASLTANTTGTYEDTTHTDSVAQNDLVNYTYSALGGSATCTVVKAGVTADAATSVNYSDSVTEAMTLGDTGSAGASLTSTISEALTLAQTSDTGGNTFGAAVTENIGLAEVLGDTTDVSDAEAEAMTLGDTVDASMGQSAAISEAMSLGDTSDGAKGQAATVSEALSLDAEIDAFIVPLANSVIVIVIG